LNNRTQLGIIAIICLIVGTASGYGLSYTIYQPKIERHEKQVSDLALEIAELNSTISSQTSRISALEAEYTSLNQSYYELLWGGPTPIIPRETLFGNPDKSTVQLSPDGTRISYRAPVDGVMNVWVGPADDPSAAKPVTNDTFRGIPSYGWTYTSEHILYLQDQAGNENWRVYSVNLNSGETVDLTPLEGVQARIQAFSPEFPNEMIVALNDRIPYLHDLYRVNIDTGERILILENNEGFVGGFIFDDEFNVRLAARMTADGGVDFLSPTDEGGWELFMEIPMEDVLTTSPVWFDKTGKVLYMIDSRGRDTSALFSLDLETGEQTLIAEDPMADLSDVMMHPTEYNVQAVAFTYERKHWQILDESIAEDLAYLGTVADGDVEVTSRTLDDGHWMVVYLMDNGPVRYYRYDREEQEAQFLFAHREALEGLPLAKMHPVIIESRDGLNLVSYYTLPVGSNSDGDAHPDEPLPMVLWVHGGPWGRDNWGYNPVHQWLANRGYAVLSVNFRSSTGFGKDFINAGNLEWGGKMHEDLIDATEWAIQEGIADPDQVAIMGGSYGGYATLVGLTFTPERFACGVDIVGISNLVTWIETIPPYWAPQIELFATRIGDHRTEEGRAFLTERSPLTYVDQIQRPLLIGQGVNDPRVPQAESDQIVQAMQERDIPVTYLLYPDEGHGFARPENSMSFFAVTEAFLTDYLGGRYEPIGDDFEGSSITVPVGDEHVPGLTEALSRAFPTPEEVRNAVMSYIRYHHPTTTRLIGDIVWSGGDITPSGLVGKTTYQYLGGEWNVTISWAVIAKPTFEVRAEYSSPTRDLSIYWEGTVDQIGAVQEKIKGSYQGVESVRDAVMDYIRENHPDVAIYIEDLFWNVTPPEPIPGWTEYHYIGDGWNVTIGYVVYYDITYEVTAENRQEGIIWTGTVYDGVVNETSYEK